MNKLKCQLLRTLLVRRFSCPLLVCCMTAAFSFSAFAEDGYYIFQGGNGNRDGTGNSVKLEYQKDGDKAVPYVLLKGGGTGGGGDASAANQTTANNSLASIDGKLPALSGGAVPVTSATATTVVSTALEASRVLKPSAGSLVSLHVYNAKTSAQFILIMNSATVPANGAVTLLYPPINVPASSNVSLNFTTPLAASAGISVSNSSTGTFTKTIGSADCIFTAQVQ
jgi:hypothetical protein